MVDGVVTLAVGPFSPKIFLRNVPVQLDLGAIRSHFSAFGEIVAAVKFEGDCAIIVFKKLSAMEASLKSITHQIGDHKILCQATSLYLEHKLPNPSQSGACFPFPFIYFSKCVHNIFLMLLVAMQNAI